MTKRNPNLSKLKANYLFPEIRHRKQEFLKQNPHAPLISLGVGDTTEPIPESIVEAIKLSAHRHGTREGYTGYGDEQGFPELRRWIASRLYQDKFTPDEIFI
jgi:LL-diaminopimelate aminotransferase